MIYIQQNEETNRLRIVTVENEHFKAAENLHRDIETLDRAYPDIDVTYERINGYFGPELIQDLSEKWAYSNQLHVHRLSWPAVSVPR